jgi:hypothetical protein
MLHPQAATTHVQVLGLIERKSSLPTILEKLKHLPEALVIETYDTLRCEQFDVERCFDVA